MTTKRKQAQAKKPVQNIDNSKTVAGCTFTGVHWDAQAVGAVQTVADGLVANAKALGALAEVFKGQNIRMAPMIYVGEELRTQAPWLNKEDQ
jgi:hypothetical protein